MLVGLSSCASRDDVRWETLVSHKGAERNLRAMPSVKVQKVVGSTALIRIENRTGLTLTYYGYGRECPQTFVKERRFGRWVDTSFAWCGTGLSAYRLRDSQSVVLRVHDPETPRQIFTIFRNATDQDEYSLVKLYERGQ